ncbi:phosphoesterase, partial [Streptomyces sp. SID10692]|nr:phosphoesterase [Streptomyces sp. SID10692]
MSTARTSSATSTATARLRGWLQSRDLAVFRSVADRHWPGADPLLPKLSRSANHGLLWFGTAAGIAALGGSARSRRAALRGAAS